MKVVIEVVATNMESGHIAVSQETVDLDISQYPISEQGQFSKGLTKRVNKSGLLEPRKIGPILITRHITYFPH